MTQTATRIPMPKIAQQFIDDAKAAGHKVEVSGWDATGVSVFVETEFGSSAGVTWAQTVVYDTPLSGERLGFRTGGGKVKVRFAYASGYSRHEGHTCPRSVRQARAIVGLAI